MTTATRATTDVASVAELRQRLDAAPMSRAQIVAIAVTVAISALDGYDILSVGFAAPAIARDWGIDKSTLGLVFAAGLGGMAIGSLVLAPLADIAGRRRTVIGSLALMALGMLLCAQSRSFPHLAIARMITGLGIGAMVAVISSVAAEFANARRRPLALALMTIGYPLGGMIGGLLASFLLSIFGWQAVFIAGFVAACLLIPIVLLFLPEPIPFLLVRRGPRTLARVNALLGAYGQPPLTTLPPAEPTPPRMAYSAVFTPAQRRTTTVVTIVNLLYVITVYFVLSWMPQIIADLGFPPSKASVVAAAANTAGVAGGILVGLCARLFSLNRLTATMMIGAGLATAMLGSVDANLPRIIGMAAASGFFVFGGMAGLYGTLASSFSVQARASGVGFVIGVGRMGSACAPALAGWMYTWKLNEGAISFLFGACAITAGLILLLLRPSAHVPD